MAIGRTLKVTDSVFVAFGRLKIEIASPLGRIPTNSELIAALTAIGNTHSIELVNVLTETKTGK